MALSLAELLAGGTLLYMMSDSKSKNQKLDIFRKRSFEGLNQDTQDVVELITFDDKTRPVGSFKYKVHKYPGDIDIFEPVKICCDKKTALDSIVRELKSIAKRVRDSKKIFWGDFKAGLDLRFFVEEKDLQSKKDRDDYLNRVSSLLTASELKKLESAPDADHFYELVRKLFVVRWTDNDIINGSVTLRKNYKLGLEDALAQDTIVKLDLWAPIFGGNYNEVTNFFLFVWVDKDGKEHVINSELGDRLASLDRDIKKYSSKAHWKPLKLAKRLWNKAIYTHDTYTAKKLYPLFASGASALNQVVGESEVIRAMLEKLPNPPMDKLKRQIIGFKRRINDVSDISFNDKELYRLIDKTDFSNKQNIIATLEQLENKLEPIINHYAENYLQQHAVLSIW